MTESDVWLNSSSVLAYSSPCGCLLYTSLHYLFRVSCSVGLLFLTILALTVFFILCYSRIPSLNIACCILSRSPSVVLEMPFHRCLNKWSYNGKPFAGCLKVPPLLFFLGGLSQLYYCVGRASFSWTPLLETVPLITVLSAIHGRFIPCPFIGSWEAALLGHIFD